MILIKDENEQFKIQVYLASNTDTCLKKLIKLMPDNELEKII